MVLPQITFRIIQLAVDNQISRSTGYAYLHEGLTMLAAQDIMSIDACDWSTRYDRWSLSYG